MNSRKFNKKYREFKICDDFHDDIKFYISDEQLNKDVHIIIEENKELKNKVTKLRNIIRQVEEDVLVIVNLLASYKSDVNNKDLFMCEVENFTNKISDYLNKVCVDFKRGDEDEE